MFQKLLRQNAQLFTHYAKLFSWTQTNLIKNFIRNSNNSNSNNNIYFNPRVRKRLKLLTLGLSAITTSSKKKDFNWKRFSLNDSVINHHKRDVEEAKKLLNSTLKCRNCAKRHPIDSTAKVANVDYCDCSEKIVNGVYGEKMDPNSDWTPFLERLDLVVWRRDHDRDKARASAFNFLTRTSLSGIPE